MMCAALGTASHAGTGRFVDPMTREQLFLTQLPEIERVIRSVCARRALFGADAQDFTSIVKYRLIENDYEVLAKFKGLCSLRTFLTTVVTRLYLDFQVQRFGKWRNSAAALRMGPVATRLERLIHRDKLSFDEACSVLASDGRVTESRDALYEIVLKLPQRPRPWRDSAPAEPNAGPAATLNVERAERQELALRTFTVIRSSLARLPGRDRLLLRMTLVEGLTVAQVSRALGLDQQALYKKREALFRSLRADLEAAGIGAADAQELLSTIDWEAELFDEDLVAEELVAGGMPGKEAGSRPSSQLLTGDDGKVSRD
jgi:RNA polymerase sigma factor for flagellar operon FliA